ncbi:MAG: hypothetical protein GFH27_549319n97 [Chloroflexi bacterium AL-W]|nr:hypothetical protein [Chloroflexi bacterium AL-N1]NOK71260.1 hypothetical protein [Chloroflexi bacterium AL-N10]NOK77635.1 hypothetical protein [Chloroflexi bacterium AL-N5]NOK84486.1 hypothetical protein [Chloroflexi bacterium AL-W]NOK92937.1 hypothetical protein [Chloroflexi bacterium AL-N15]
MIAKRTILLLLLATMLLAACEIQPGPALTPTLEAVLPMLPTDPPAPEAPTATPIPLEPNEEGTLPTITPVPLEDGAITPSPETNENTSPLETGEITTLVGAMPTANCLAGDVTRLPYQSYGINVYVNDATLDQTLDRARELNVGWVRTTLRWRDMEPQQGTYRWEQLDALTNATTSRGLRLVLAISEAPSWANSNGGLPEQPDDLGAFMGALASHVGETVAAYEIWPGPNTAAANGGTFADPGEYVAVLSSAYRSIKATNPCAIVFNGSLVPTAERESSVALDDLVFYREMLSYNNGEFADVHDILAVQLNTSGQRRKGDWPGENPNLSRGAYGHVAVLRDEMIYQGEGEKQVWAVAFGYSVEGEFAVSPEQQAAYLVELLDWSRNAYPWVSGVFVRDLSLSQLPDSTVVAYNLLNPDGSPRPAFGAMQEYVGKEREKANDARPIKGTDLIMLWSYRPIIDAHEQLVLGQQGAIYSPTGRGYVRVIDPNGAFQTMVKPGNKRVSGVATDGQRFYATTNLETLSAFSNGGTPIWSVLTSGEPILPLLISQDSQTLYTATGREMVEAFATTDGSTRWQAQLNGIPGTLAVGADGTAYVGTTEGLFYAITSDGSTRWQYPAEAWARVAPVVDGDTVYGATDTGVVFALSPDGAPQWRVERGAEVVGLALGPDGVLYVTTADSQLHAFNPDGSDRWVLPLDGGRPTEPVVDNDGRIYLGAEDGGFRVIAPDGRVEGIFGFNDPITIAPLVGLDGAVYVTYGEGEKALVAFGPAHLRDQYWIP